MKPPSDEPADDEQDADGVEHVIDVEAVARPLVMAHARERAVEAVAEPVHGQEQHDARRAPTASEAPIQ